MQLVYSELINRFSDALGAPKPLIEETFNKPDMADVIVNHCISYKRFNDFYILIVFQMDGQIVNISNAYRIYPQMLNGNGVEKRRPIDVLKDFMERYGMPKDISGYGQHKFFVEKSLNIFFPGILDIGLYTEAVRSLQNG